MLSVSMPLSFWETCRRLDEIEAERARKAAEAAAQEEKERHQMYLRRQERERTNHHSKEEEVVVCPKTEGHMPAHTPCCMLSRVKAHADA